MSTMINKVVIVFGTKMIWDVCCKIWEFFFYCVWSLLNLVAVCNEYIYIWCCFYSRLRFYLMSLLKKLVLC